LTENRLCDYLDHMRQAAANACGFLEGLEKVEFLSDLRTQQAVIMNLIIIGEAATRVMDRYSAFADAHSEVPWRNMRGMRNRITHGYFDINLDVVWDTVQTALPALLVQLECIRHDVPSEGNDDALSQSLEDGGPPSS